MVEMYCNELITVCGGGLQNYASSPMLVGVNQPSYFKPSHPPAPVLYSGNVCYY